MPQPVRSPAEKFTALPSPLLFALLFAAVALTHLTLLRLPYFWDEGGYYIPAAWDFYSTGTLIPLYSNAHTPLPNILIGTLWHIVGYHILATRLLDAAFAAAALLAVLRLTQRILSPAAAIAVTLLTACYPIWFAQSTLAHADLFSAAFTLWAFTLYFTAKDTPTETSTQQRTLIALLFSLAALSKETSIVQPAALAALELALILLDRSSRQLVLNHLRWLAALSFPLLPLIVWFAYHHHKVGFTFGNPDYLRYNATANFTAAHVLYALRIRFLHLFWQRNIWLPLVLALACLLLPLRDRSKPLQRITLVTIGVLVAANWLAFSILGGALLTRYLLPIYPLILLVCVSIWRDRTPRWPLLAAFTAVAFISALWLNPPTAFAPEDNLTYRDMIVVHQRAIDYLSQHYPNATVLTAWPVAGDITRPELGYTNLRYKIVPIDDFSAANIHKASLEPGAFDTALIFSTHYTSPSLRQYLIAHPHSHRGAEYAANRDLLPLEAAAILGGTVVKQWELNGEWAAILRFDRSYEAQLTPPPPSADNPPTR